jgi:hypothetical protein
VSLLQSQWLFRVQLLLHARILKAADLRMQAGSGMSRAARQLAHEKAYDGRLQAEVSNLLNMQCC